MLKAYAAFRSALLVAAVPGCKSSVWFHWFSIVAVSWLWIVCLISLVFHRPTGRCACQNVHRCKVPYGADTAGGWHGPPTPFGHCCRSSLGRDEAPWSWLMGAYECADILCSLHATQTWKYCCLFTPFWWLRFGNYGVSSVSLDWSVAGCGPSFPILTLFGLFLLLLFCASSHRGCNIIAATRKCRFCLSHSSWLQSWRKQPLRRLFW